MNQKELGNSLTMLPIPCALCVVRMRFVNEARWKKLLVVMKSMRARKQGIASLLCAWGETSFTCWNCQTIQMAQESQTLPVVNSTCKEICAFPSTAVDLTIRKPRIVRLIAQLM